MTYTCKRCGGEITGHNRKKAKFCSRACYHEGAKLTPEQAEALFWEKVDKSPAHGGCWLYMGFRKWDGYGWLAREIPGRKSRYLTAHRYAWILTHGEVPDGLHVLHQCDNPPCCNPAHMRLGTHKENMGEMKKRGRANGGHWTKRKPVLHPNRIRPERGAE